MLFPLDIARPIGTIVPLIPPLDIVHGKCERGAIKKIRLDSLPVSVRDFSPGPRAQRAQLNVTACNALSNFFSYATFLSSHSRARDLG